MRGLTAILMFVTLPAAAGGYDKAVVACVAGGSQEARLSPCETTQDKPVSLAVLLRSTSRPARWCGAASALRLDGKSLPVSPCQDAAALRVRWFKVEPLMYHADGHGHDPANPTFLWYANAGAPGGRTDRQPLPPDTIKYFENEQAPLRDKWLVQADAHPSDPAYDKNGGLGTMRYTAAVEGQGWRLAAPTLKDFNPSRGQRDETARVVIRADDSYVGYLTGFFNVPGVFGPYANEIEGHLGVDCSHLVVGAWRERNGGRVPFTNVTGLRTNHVKRGYLTDMTGDLWLDGGGKFWRSYDVAKKQLADPVEVNARRGDLVLFNYSTNPKRRQWDHIGVVYEGDGALGGETRLLHSGPHEADLDRLADPKFASPGEPTRVAVLRWKEGG